MALWEVIEGKLSSLINTPFRLRCELSSLHLSLTRIQNRNLFILLYALLWECSIFLLSTIYFQLKFPPPHILYVFPLPHYFYTPSSQPIEVFSTHTHSKDEWKTKLKNSSLRLWRTKGAEVKKIQSNKSKSLNVWFYLGRNYHSWLS